MSDHEPVLKPLPVDDPHAWYCATCGKLISLDWQTDGRYILRHYADTVAAAVDPRVLLAARKLAAFQGEEWIFDPPPMDGQTRSSTAPEVYLRRGAELVDAIVPDKDLTKDPELLEELEDLDALKVGAVVIDLRANVFEKFPSGGWYMPGDDWQYETKDIVRPARVIHRGNQ